MHAPITQHVDNTHINTHNNTNNANNTTTTTITPLQIYVQDAAADADRFCWLVLHDAVGRVSDKARVPFFTNATQWGELPAGGLKGGGDGVGARLSRAECAQACGALHNVRCHWRNKCWQRIGAFFGLIGGLVGGRERLGRLCINREGCVWG